MLETAVTKSGESRHAVVGSNDSKTQKGNRLIGVTMSKNSLGVYLTWAESINGEFTGTREVYFEYPLTGVLESVNKSICKFVNKNISVSIERGCLTVISEIERGRYGMFDMVASAEEPVQAFISRYVLEG